MISAWNPQSHSFGFSLQRNPGYPRLSSPKNVGCRYVPSGKHTKNYGESQFLIRKSPINKWAIFNSYVSLPEGIPVLYSPMSCRDCGAMACCNSACPSGQRLRFTCSLWQIDPWSNYMGIHGLWSSHPWDSLQQICKPLWKKSENEIDEPSSHELEVVRLP